LRAWLKGRRAAGLDVDDIVQETYARLAALHSVADVRNPKTYAFQTAYAIIVTHLRRRRVIPIHAVADLEELEATSHQFSPEREVESWDELQQLARIIGSLPDKCRQVFVLRRVDGLSQREVAKRLGLAESTIEKHMARGIRALMDVFGRGEKLPPDASRTSQPHKHQHGKPAVGPGD
jgi:RNA polymerase sigma factor (sigma-70 family)